MPSSSLFNDPEQMRDLRDGAAHRWCIGALDDLIQLSKSQTLNDVLMLPRARNRAAVILNLDRGRLGFAAFCFPGHIVTQT